MGEVNEKQLREELEKLRKLVVDLEADRRGWQDRYHVEREERLLAEEECVKLDTQVRGHERAMGRIRMCPVFPQLVRQLQASESEHG